MEIAGQMALKHKKNSLPRYKYTKYSVFQRESYSWYSKTSEERLPGLVEAAQARKDVNLPASRAIYDRGIAHVWKIGGGLLQS